MKEIKEKFIKEVVECLKEEALDVPYLVVPLVQAIDKKELDEFFEDLGKHENYSYYYENDSTGGFTNGCVTINLPECSYKIEFGLDERYFGYCECSPDDEGYHSVKQCCGHGCDWDAPTITLHKIKTLFKHSFNGDEHAFWDFEDGYYKLDKEASEEKARKEKENRVTYLRSNIERMQLELAELA